MAWFGSWTKSSGKLTKIFGLIESKYWLNKPQFGKLSYLIRCCMSPDWKYNDFSVKYFAATDAFEIPPGLIKLIKCVTIV